MHKRNERSFCCSRAQRSQTIDRNEIYRVCAAIDVIVEVWSAAQRVNTMYQFVKQTRAAAASAAHQMHYCCHFVLLFD